MALCYVYSYNTIYWDIYFYFISFASIIFIFSHNSDSVMLLSALCYSYTERFCVGSTHSSFPALRTTRSILFRTKVYLITYSNCIHCSDIN